MMESIGKLRELCAKWRKTSITPGRNSAADEVDAIADEIEREIAERYMELPVDADGVSIHIGDELETAHGGKVIVEYVGECEVRVYQDGEHYRISQDEYAYICRHVKPRTVDDVLREFTEKYQYCISDDGRAITLAKYADELRGMGVGE